MKKLKVLLSLVLVIALITGCNQKKETEESTTTGGWTLDLTSQTAENIDENAKKAFEKATENYTGMSFDLIAVLGTQIVAGTNYMYLCQGTTVTATPESSYKVVVVYADLVGGATITSVKDFNLSDYTFKDVDTETESNLSGGWTINSSLENSNVQEKDVFEKAFETYTGVSYKPIVHLGTQVVAGTNHAYLALGTTATKNPTNTLSVITIYEDLSNNTEIESIANIDLSNFTE